MYNFSVYENSTKHFELVSTPEDIYPNVTSIESFQGRKCYEFQWTDYNKSFGIGVQMETKNGVYRAFFWGGNNNYYGQYMSRFGEEWNNTNISLAFDKNVRYMVCIDTISNTIHLLNSTDYIMKHSFSLPVPHIKKWTFFLENSNSNRKISMDVWFDYPFTIPIPQGFFSFIDPRCIERNTCYSRQPFFSYSYLCIFLLLN